MKNLTKYIILLFLLTLLSCDKNEFKGPTVVGKVVIENLNGDVTGLTNKSSSKIQGRELGQAASWIHSSSPEYLKVTLLDIELKGSFDGASKQIWKGEKEIVLTGESIDISDINSQLSEIPVGEITGLVVRFKSKAKIKGSLTGRFKLDDSNGPSGLSEQLTLYTKAEHSYNSLNASGGADDYSVFEVAPAEEAEIWLDSSGDELTLEFPISTSINEGESPQITMFFDLNRTLRFFNGKRGVTGNGGVNPGDPDNKAYFFNHSLFGSFISVFIGKKGSIEGYKTVHHVGDGTVDGWLSLVFDADNNFVSGLILGDDDNALTIAKGRITEFTAQDASTYNFTYSLDGEGTSFSVTGFQRLSTVGDSNSATFSGNLGNNAMNGDCSFTLRLKK